MIGNGGLFIFIIVIKYQTSKQPKFGTQFHITDLGIYFKLLNILNSYPLDDSSRKCLFLHRKNVLV